MSGHRKFSELTKDFSVSDRREIENMRAQMKAELESGAERVSTEDSEAKQSSPSGETTA